MAGMPMDTTTQETWKPVVGFEDWYQVSDLGRIRRSAPGRRTHVGRIVTLSRNTYGYLQADLHVNGKSHTTTVHKCVTAAFLGPCPDGMQVDHINGDKTDNRVENLRYVTQADNIRHCYRLAREGRISHNGIGESHPCSKLTEEQVRMVRHLLSIGMPATQIAKRYGVSDRAIGKILHGDTWTHV